MSPSIRKLLSFISRTVGLHVQRYNLHSSENALIQHLLKLQAIDYIVDVGANSGQYAQLLREHGFVGRILSLEPLTSAFEELERNAAKDANWEILRVAAGSSAGRKPINLSRNSVSSSLLRLTAEGEQTLHGIAYEAQEIVDLITLDSLLADGRIERNSSLFIKMDVQGYELEVLRGAEKILSIARGLQIEMSFDYIYEDCPLYSEIIDYLMARGFVLYSLIPGFRDERTGRMLQADGLFTRRGL